MNKNYSVLIVDDEKIQRDSLSGFLKKSGYQTFTAANVEQAMQVASAHIIDLVFSDFKMGDKTGYDLLLELKQLNPEISVVIMTAFGTIQSAVQAMKAGAFDYLTKPIDLDEVEIILRRAQELRHLIRENRSLRDRLREKHKLSGIITNSPLMAETLSLAARAADSKTSVLVQGESGTGKELIARAIHQASPRNKEPMVTINCAAISENLLESELFGHEKGAFTGAIRQKQGRVEEADGGTLFLDEVGDIPLPIQVKLLRFLQFGEFQRVGGTESLRVDIRLISATNRNLEEMIRNNTFREDFYYRLNVIKIQVPPLRQRKEDIPLLIDHFIHQYAKRNEKQVDQLSGDALDLLMKYDFPGNVRELENMIERAVVLCRDRIIQKSDLPLTLQSLRSGSMENAPLEFYTGTFRDKVEAFERDLIEAALKENHFNQTKAAKALGLNERNLRYKLRKYGMK